ncbi:MAG: tripartite tricarboxylate transporter TctB family protein [Devosia sp.]|nr:tripartite tricarboxylate transporter TctB family protein [Devosia sp.]
MTRNPRTRFRKDFYGGGLMVLIGLFAAYQGASYKIGTLSRMGPGLLPVALGVLLAAIGCTIAMTARASDPEAPDRKRRPEWRGWFCISAGVVAFIVLGRYGGLVPAAFAIVFISALGDRDNTVLGAFILAGALVIVAVVVFWWGLQLQLPLFQWG